MLASRPPTGYYCARRGDGVGRAAWRGRREEQRVAADDVVGVEARASAAPRDGRANLLRLAGQYAVLIAGLFCFALGLVLTLKSALGLGPWDVFHWGLKRHTGLTFGQANIVVSLVVLLVAWALGQRPRIATVLNMLLVGTFVDLINRAGVIPSVEHHAWAVRLLVDLAGVAVVGLGTAFYIKGDLGAGPRDGLMLVLTRRTGRPIALVRASIELSVLVVGFFLGGTAGIGTLVFAFGIGPAVALAFRLFRVDAHK